MSIANTLPTMTDAELATLHKNARRLADEGTPAQQKAAAALIPAISAELSVRSDAAATRKAEALALRRATKVKSDTTVVG